jgi:hypothetical protein
LIARPYRTAAFCLGGVLFAGSPAVAQECVEEMSAVDAENVGMRQHLSEQELRGFTTLRQAARFLSQNEREDACEELSETYAEMVSERREQLVDEGQMVEIDEQERIDQLKEAPMVSELDQPLSAGRIIGSDLRNLKNDDLGAAVPLQTLRIADNGNTFVLDMASERFEEAPTLEDAQTAGEDWLQQNDSYYEAAQ